jgi:hypothetical protein
VFTNIIAVTQCPWFKLVEPLPLVRPMAHDQLAGLGDSVQVHTTCSVFANRVPCRPCRPCRRRPCRPARPGLEVNWAYGPQTVFRVRRGPGDWVTLTVGGNRRPSRTVSAAMMDSSPSSSNLKSHSRRQLGEPDIMHQRVPVDRPRVY